MDSVQEETLAVFATEVIVDREHDRPLLLQRRRHRLTEESPRKALVPGESVLVEGKVSKRAKITSKELVRIRHVKSRRQSLQGHKAPLEKSGTKGCTARSDTKV